MKESLLDMVKELKVGSTEVNMMEIGMKIKCKAKVNISILMEMFT